MRMPPIHFDHMRKHLPYIQQLAKRTLSPLTLEHMIAGASTDEFNEASAHLGASAQNAMHQMEMFDRCGQQVFVVGPQMAEAFRNTDLSGMMSDWIESPAHCYYIALSECPWEMFGGLSSGWHKVAGVYVQYSHRQMWNSTKRKPGLHFLLWGAPNERSHGPLDDAVYWFSIETGLKSGEDVDLETRFGGSEVMNTDKPFATGWAPGLLDDLDSGDPEVRLKHRQTIQNVFRLVINLSLYLESESSDVSLVKDNPVERRKLEGSIRRAKSEGRRRKLRRRLENAPRTVITYVGPSVETRLREASAGSERATGTRSSPRWHLVRPHWRHYWVGPKSNQKRVRKWIGLTERGSAEPDRHVTKIREPG